MDMDPKVLEYIYNVLVTECGMYKSTDDLTAFGIHFPDCREYRFQGRLGFGGKVWAHTYGGGHFIAVSCYPEDLTSERYEMIDRANVLLSIVAWDAKAGWFFKEKLHGIAFDDDGGVTHFAWPGAYRVWYYTDDGGELCAECVQENLIQILTSDAGDGWYVIAHGSEADSDTNGPCDHCNRHLDVLDYDGDLDGQGSDG